MKNLLLIILLMMTNTLFAQTYTKYEVVGIDTSALVPRYLIGVNQNTNATDTLGIVITLKQAMKINTDYDILNLYRGLHKECDSTVNYLVQVVDDYKKSDIMAQATINACKKNNDDLKNQVANLKEQISVSAARLMVKDSTISAKDSLIGIEKKKTKKFKKQRNITVIGAAVLMFFEYMLLKH